MTVRALSWLGLVSADVERDRAFFVTALGMTCELETDTFAVLTADNGDVIELFKAADPAHAHFTTGPVPGLRVDDLEAAAARVAQAGAELIGAVHTGSRGNRWVHFRAPDGTIFELLEIPEPAELPGEPR